MFNVTDWRTSDVVLIIDLGMSNTRFYLFNYVSFVSYRQHNTFTFYTRFGQHNDIIHAILCKHIFLKYFANVMETSFLGDIYRYGTVIVCNKNIIDHRDSI